MIVIGHLDCGNFTEVNVKLHCLVLSEIKLYKYLCRKHQNMSTYILDGIVNFRETVRAQLLSVALCHELVASSCYPDIKSFRRTLQTIFCDNCGV